MQWLNIDLPEEFESVSLVPFADLHKGAPEFNEKKFVLYRDWILDAPNRFSLINGDAVNNAVKSSVSNVYEETMRPREQVRYMANLLSPLVQDKRLWFIAPGNHEYRSDKEVDLSPAEQLADKLGVPYVEDGAFLKIRVGKQTAFNSKPVVYTAYITHGAGSGKTEGAVANMLREMALSNLAHIYVMAHRHIALAFESEYGVPDLYNGNLRMWHQLFVCVPSFTEWGGYAERKLMRRRRTGAVRIDLSGREQKASVTIGDIF